MKSKFLIILIVSGLIAVFLYFRDEKVYALKKYNAEGQLLRTNEYVLRNGDTIFHGKFTRYNEKGIKISEGKFVDNEPNGNCFYYYDNGKLESVFYRKNSEINLECTYYNQNGLMDKYIMCDSLGKTAFIIKFNDKVVKMYDGYSIWPIDQYKLVNNKQYGIKTVDILKIGDTIRYNYLVANIPYAKRTFKIETVGADNSKAKRIIKSKLPTEIIVEEVLTKKGLNRIQIVAQYQFEDKVTPTLNKVVSFDVYVN
ncbi:toxin-antitoxin system YwqK family antitoxin [Flavobacterium hercynium]|uniref:MORN repeat protein n=1 Tax=Flavobacterium hercynium TaxID=387094 RepID=A0A226HGE3_9FLAO|nr:hypothetical protein [Flavobacterium hercynium]OXA92510.1 hypothetical protein B0A66_09520 [Flavobacterium hercynium]SMP21607.1 hypothetical protein SAMN06265346_10752 [Flavobacterium hercynium]